MYTPAAFNESDHTKLFAMIQQHSFGLLISHHAGEPVATHLPMLVDRSIGPHGQLIGHMARANPHWQQADGQPVLAVFSGPHAYISPSWYEADNVVPTWNYVAIHAYGIFRAIHGEPEMMQVVQDTVNFYEAAMPNPWKLDTARESSRLMVKGIVGFRIELTRLEGKLKLSQNHPHARQEKVAQALSASTDRNAREIADLMTTILPKDHP